MTMLKTSLYENQKFNHNELIKRRRALLVDKAGNGKCKGGIARIQTSEGLIKFKDLLKDAPYGVSQPNRKITVSTRNGVKRITHFYKEANCKLNYITFTNGTTTTGTDDHPILVLRNNEVVFIKMKYIKLGDYVAFSKEPAHVYTESSADSTYQTFILLGKSTVTGEYSDSALPGLKESLEYDSSLPKDVWKGSVLQKKYFIKGLIIAGGFIRDTTIEIKLPNRIVACDVASIALSIGLNITLIDTSVVLIGHSIESMSDCFLQNPIDENNIKYTHGLDKLMNTFDYSRQPTIPLIYNNGLEFVMAEYSYENTPVMTVSEYSLLKLGKYNPLYKLTEYTYHQVTQKESTAEDVYDVTVQDEHEFLSDGIINHNTLSCLAAFATLKEHKKLDIMIVLTPLNAYKKLVWKNDAASKTLLKTVDIEVLHKRYESNPTKIRQVVETFDVIYAKHSHVRQIPEMFQMLTQEFKTLVVFDEVHAFKNPNSALTVRAKYALQRAYAIWSLTATPLSKKYGRHLQHCQFYISLVSWAISHI